MAVKDRVQVVDDLVSFSQVRLLDRDWTTLIENVSLATITGHPMVREAWEPIRRLEFRFDVTPVREWMRVEVTGTWGFPAVPGNLRQAVLDAVAWVLDRDVEHYSEDLGPSQEGGNVVLIGQGQRTISLPLSALEVAQ